jgi:cytochrome c
MIRLRTVSLALVAAACLFTTGSATAADPPPAFAPCKACHAIVADKNMVGPSLFGVYGRKAGTLPSFIKYSSELKSWNMTLSDGGLDTWLTNPKAISPKTVMSVRVADPAARTSLILFLQALK